MFADANLGKAVFEIQRLGGGIAGADFQQQALDTGGLGVAEPMFQKCGGNALAAVFGGVAIKCSSDSSNISCHTIKPLMTPSVSQTHSLCVLCANAEANCFTDQGEGLLTASIAARAGQSSEKAGRIFMPALSVLPALSRSGRLCCGHKAIRHARHRTRDNAR